MERLTRHFDESKNESLELYDVRDVGLELRKNEKLSKLEDIEEDLGIDLITLFKAQTEGIWELAFNGYDKEIKPTYKPRKVTRQLCIDFKQKTLAEMWWRYDFKDYGKKELGGWALTKEELE